MRYLAPILVVLISITLSCKDKDNLRLLSAEKGASVLDNGWEKEHWSRQENYATVPSENNNTEVLVLEADTLSRSRWYKKVNIKPYTTYKVTGYVKTEGVEGDRDGAGAGIGLERMEVGQDTIFVGDNDWTLVELVFNSKGEDSFMLEGLLGKRGLAKGKVYFDNFQLEELDSKELNPMVTIDLSKKKEPMSPYIYGQFIEHMGKGIYGGIWAEMLQDRKFYYHPGTKKSPWKANVDTLDIQKDTSHSFAELDLPRFSLNSDGILLFQDSLATIKGKKYEGRVVLSHSGSISSASVGLITENGSSEQSLDISGSGYQKIPFELDSEENSSNARLEIKIVGSGTVTIAAVSLMPEDNVEGFRPDVLALLKELNSPIYRWPGGNFVSGYDWKDGIGDPDRRPTKYERAWNGLEYNDVGVHEFMDLCRLLGAEANVAVNTGLGTAELAADEVEYFNGDRSTKMGKWRAENGHPEPYGVKLWAVGNEMFGDWQLGHMPVEDYVVKHNKVAEAMWAVDPSIDLIAVGFPGEWNDMMYEHTLDNMTYISEHFYRQDWHAGGLLTHVKQIPDAIREIADEHRRCREEMPKVGERKVKIALDEWNYWYGPHVYGLLGTRYFLRDALGIAAGINEFSRQSDMFYMANYAQTVNVIGAIKTTKTDSWLEGTGLVLKLYRKEFGTQPVAIEGAPEPLDVAVTTDEEGTLVTVSVINATHQEYPLVLNFEDIELPESRRRYFISGADDMVFNDESDKNRITIQEETIAWDGHSLIVPKESANIYTFKLK